MVISSHLCSFKFVLAWLYFAKQASLFYNRNWFLLVIYHLQAARILPQVTDEGVNPHQGVRPGAGLLSLNGLATAMSANISNPFLCLFCITPGLRLNAVKIRRLNPWANIWPFPRAGLSGSHKSFPDSTLLPKSSRSVSVAAPHSAGTHGLPLHSPPGSGEPTFLSHKLLQNVALKSRKIF